MSIPEMLLLVAIMYGVLMFFLSFGMISLAKHSLIAFGVKFKSHNLDNVGGK